MSIEKKVTKNVISFKKEFNLKSNVTQNGMLLKTECHSKWKVT